MMKAKAKRRHPRSANRQPIHPSIKKSLGYRLDEPDADVLRDWNARLRRVCKPCWELKYCPYGPLVEQSPTIPPARDGMVEQIEYFHRCLDTNLVGSSVELTSETRQQYEQWAGDDQILLAQARYELNHRATLEDASKASSDDEKIKRWLGAPLPPIHIYRAAYENEEGAIVESDYPPDIWRSLRAEADAFKVKYLEALKTGKLDHRSPLEPARRAWFRRRVESFNQDDYPERVPATFAKGECNVYGHVCPVFFAAEASTETSAERRRGRYIPFDVKMRVVRRDNYTCQHCAKHLKDNEVEFDHIIPVSKGGTATRATTTFRSQREFPGSG